MATMALQQLTATVVLLVTLTLFHIAPQQVQSAKILSVAFISSKSHKIVYEPLLYELAARGHEVTILNPYISGKPMKNIRELQTIDVEEVLKQMPNMYEMKQRGEDMNPFKMLDFFGQVCADTFDLPVVKQVLEEKFDLVIASAVFNECTAGFIYKLNTTLIIVSPVTAPTWVASLFGNPNPPSFVPNLFTGFDEQMNFYERTLNLLAEGANKVIHRWFFQPAMARIYREKLNDPNIPLNDEIISNASLILSNSHFTISKPRPFLPDIVEVGGMHCRTAKQLPKDLDDFLNSAGPEGAIYFSMGSALKGSEMPESYRKLFLGAFSKLKQKVLWKWETEKMDGLPSNVKLSKWLPQQDVLGHKNVKVFITHGGFGGTTEAIYHGVPLVGIAMFGDQLLNMKKSEKLGYAVSLDFNTLSEKDLLDGINRVLTEPAFRENIERLSKTFRDQPDKPLDRAVFWTEYVLKHKGAIHLRSAGRELNFLQFHSIDVVATLLGSVVLVLYLLYATCKFIVRKTCGWGKASVSRNGVSGKKKRN